MTEQEKIFMEAAGMALTRPDFRKAVLDYPSEVLGAMGLSEKGQKTLVAALKTSNLDTTDVKDLPDLFGANLGGAFTGSIA